MVGIHTIPTAIFDVAFKRIHDKAQLLNGASSSDDQHLEDGGEPLPRTTSRARPARYWAPSRSLAHPHVGEIVNGDPGVRDLIKVVFPATTGLACEASSRRESASRSPPQHQAGYRQR